MPRGPRKGEGMQFASFKGEAPIKIAVENSKERNAVADLETAKKQVKGEKLIRRIPFDSIVFTGVVWMEPFHTD